MAIQKDQSKEAAKKAIAMAVRTKRGEVISLFKKHGVNISSSYSDPELIVGILQAMRTNERYKNDLSKLLVNTVSDNKGNFTGEAMFLFTGESIFHNAGGPGDVINAGLSSASFQNAQATAAAAQANSNSKTPFLSGTNLASLLNTGVNTLSTILTNSSNQKLAKTALEIEQQKTAQAQALAAAGGGAGLAKPGLSTGAKIAIGVTAVAILGTIIYFIVKKK